MPMNVDDMRGDGRNNPVRVEAEPAPSTRPAHGPTTPSRVDADTHAPDTDTLDTLPAGRLCTRCGRRVFVRGAHCPKPCGGFLEGNAESLTHGKHSKLALQAARERILEDLRTQYRRPDGTVAPVVDACLKEVAKLQAYSDRAVHYSERCALSLSDPRQQRVNKTMMDASDKLARWQMVLAGLTAGAGNGNVQPLKIIFGGQYKPDGSLTGGMEEDPRLMQRLERGGQRDLEVLSVSSRGEMLDALERPDPDADDESDAERVRRNSASIAAKYPPDESAPMAPVPAPAPVVTPEPEPKKQSVGFARLERWL